MKWPFGTKYRGWQIDQIPLGYLEWANRTLGKVLHGELRDEVMRTIAAAKKVERKAHSVKQADGMDELAMLRHENKLLNSEIDRLMSELFKVQMSKILYATPRQSNGSNAAKRIYRELALKWHPDKGGSQSAMQAINDFFQMLEKS
jgi:hypothetical protein